MKLALCWSEDVGLDGLMKGLMCTYVWRITAMGTLVVTAACSGTNCLMETGDSLADTANVSTMTSEATTETTTGGDTAVLNDVTRR